jgi:hypothetical protein
MSVEHIASFETRSMGTALVYRGIDEETRAELFEHSTDPGILRTLGTKDLHRFSPEDFPVWRGKGGGRYPYPARVNGNIAGLVRLGAQKFPIDHFPKAFIKPEYTATWRTAYSTPEGGDYSGEGIGKRLALAALRDYVEITRSGGPNGEPPVIESGLWLETGIDNIAGQLLYHHLGNLSRDEVPIGFVDVGTFTPEYEEGKTEFELETRLTMVATPETIGQLLVAANVLVTPA